MSAPAAIRVIPVRPSPAGAVVANLDPGARTPRYLDVDVDAGAVLRDLDIVVVAAGSVGGRLVALAARSGVRSLLIVDPDTFSPESVLTHDIGPEDVGRQKASLAGERAKAISPRTRVVVFDGPFEDLPRDVLAGADFVLLSSDGLACEQAVSRACTRLGLRLLQASLHGSTLSAQVRSLANAADGDGPGLCCGYSRREWDELDRGTVFSCTGNGRAPTSVGPPTMSPPQLCSIAADLAFMEVTRIALGIAPRIASTADVLLDYNGYTHATTTTALARNPHCPAEHSRWRIAPWPRPLSAATLRELLDAAGDARGTLSVEGYVFARRALCACGLDSPLERFVPDGESAGECPACGAPCAPHPFDAHREAPAAMLALLADRTLAELGAAGPATVLARGVDGTAVLFSESFAAPERAQTARRIR